MSCISYVSVTSFCWGLWFGSSWGGREGCFYFISEKSCWEEKVRWLQASPVNKPAHR